MDSTSTKRDSKYMPPVPESELKYRDYVDNQIGMMSRLSVKYIKEKLNVRKDTGQTIS